MNLSFLLNLITFNNLVITTLLYFLTFQIQLNQMKVEAQLNNLPTIRNIAKLLMNSMYGRFGMHTGLVQQKFVETRQLDYITKHFEIL